MFNARTHRDRFYLLRKRLGRWQSCFRNRTLSYHRDIYWKRLLQTICADMEARLLSGVRQVTFKYEEILPMIADFSIVFAIAVLQSTIGLAMLQSHVAVSVKELLTIWYAIKKRRIPWIPWITFGIRVYKIAVIIERMSKRKNNFKFQTGIFKTEISSTHQGILIINVVFLLLLLYDN